MAFKMKGFSGFVNSPMKVKEGKEKNPMPRLNESQRSKLPTPEESKAAKGTLKGLTQFEYDLKKVPTPYPELFSFGKKSFDLAKKASGKIKKYFTER